MTTETRKKELEKLNLKLQGLKLDNELEAWEKADASEELVKAHVNKCYDVELEGNDITLVHNTANDDDAFKALCKEFQNIPGIKFDDSTDHGYMEVISHHSWADTRNKVWSQYSATDIACGASDNNEVAIYWEAVRDAKEWVKEAMTDDEEEQKRAADNLASLEALGEIDDNEVIENEGGAWETMGRDGQIDHFHQHGKDYTLYICAEHTLKFNEEDF